MMIRFGHPSKKQCTIIARVTGIRESASPQSALYTITMYFMISDLDLIIIHVRYLQFNQYNFMIYIVCRKPLQRLLYYLYSPWHRIRKLLLIETPQKLGILSVDPQS